VVFTSFGCLALSGAAGALVIRSPCGESSGRDIWDSISLLEAVRMSAFIFAIVIGGLSVQPVLLISGFHPELAQRGIVAP